MELGNGFQELVDSSEQRLRFEEDCRRRRDAGLVEMTPDERLLAALEQGLPFCSGVAMGVDRLLMLRTGKIDLDEVLAFPFDRA